MLSEAEDSFEQQWLADLLRTAELRELATADCSLTACDNNPLGDYQLDPGRSDLSATQLRGCATALAGRSDLVRCVAVPPRLFLSPTTEHLERAVVCAERLAPKRPADREPPPRILVSYSSPNANKPLHLGHLRNNFLGSALANLVMASGQAAYRAAVVSDHGIHICQAAIGYRRSGVAGPERTLIKSDHFVGDQYVAYHRSAATAEGPAQAESGSDDVGHGEARELLQAVEAANGDAYRLKRTVVDWAERGIERTCVRIGSTFDSVLRERDCLATARHILDHAVHLHVCRRRDDGSIYYPSGDEEIGDVTLARGDGTLVAYAQLMGVYVYREEVLRPLQTLIVLGQEWRLGLEILRRVLRDCGYRFAETLEPVCYGMVTLIDGRMKSREGTVVEVDELLDRMAGRLLSCWDEIETPLARCERFEACEALSLATLKVHFLRVPRNKEVLYDESAIWQDSFPRLMRWIQLVHALESPLKEATTNGSTDAPGAKSRRSDDAYRRVLLLANGLPRTLRRALEHREPALVVRWLGDLAEQWQRSGTKNRARACSSGLHDTLLTRVHEALHGLNITLPRGCERVLAAFAFGHAG